MADNSDILKRLEEDQERKQNFIQELKNQIRSDELKKLKEIEIDQEISRRNKNVLIDDEMRDAHAQAKKNYYKDRLLN